MRSWNPIWCCFLCQRYFFLKANHNFIFIRWKAIFVVSYVKDTFFWKQITTAPNAPQKSCGCFLCQRYFFLKANHNSPYIMVVAVSVVSYVKDTFFWKQITTSSTTILLRCKLFLMSKILFFESKSQRLLSPGTQFRVVSYVKDTFFWKQITTGALLSTYVSLLFLMSKILFFESKSQPVANISNINTCCFLCQRYFFLKANHNLMWVRVRFHRVVSYVKDTFIFRRNL